MAKKGIKIKDLAKELGVTSRELVTRCRAEGLTVQNSVTRLSLGHARTVREWFGMPQASDASQTPSPGEGA